MSVTAPRIVVGVDDSPRGNLESRREAVRSRWIW